MRHGRVIHPFSGCLERHEHQHRAVMESPALKLSLYGYAYCPYCARVTREIERSGIDVEMVDTLRNPEARDQLYRELGRGTVPVLRIQAGGVERWLPESRDIIQYLRERFKA